MTELITAEKAQELDATGEVIQVCASALATSPDFVPIDSAIPLESAAQLSSLMHRLTGHNIAAGEEHNVTVRNVAGRAHIEAGLADCKISLNGIANVINTKAKETYTTAEKATIARRSFGVLRRFASYSSTANYRHGLVEKRGLGPNTFFIAPEHLELVEERLPFVQFRSKELKPSYSDIPCPAFRGKPVDAPRLPVQLWEMVIQIYEACGVFDSLDILNVTPQNTQLEVGGFL